MRTLAPSVSGLRALAVILTSACNLECTYCYQNAKRRRSMEWETLREAVDLLLRSRRSRTTLVFHGGEPLLEFELLRRAITYTKERRRPGQTVRLQVSTNGTLLDPEMVRFLARNRVHTQISFDGAREAQILRGAGTFEALDQLLDRVREAHPWWFRKFLSVHITLIASTVPWLAASVQYLLGKGLQEITVEPRTTYEPDWRRGDLDALEHQFGLVRRVCLAHYRRSGAVPFAPFRRPGDEEIRRPSKRALCRVGAGTSVTVDVDGQAYGCPAFATSYQTFPDFLRRRFGPMQLGDFRDPAFPRSLARYPEAVRAAGIFDDKQEQFSSYGRCGECRHFAQCMICPVSIGYAPGVPDPRRAPDFLCAFNRAMLRRRETFPRVDSAVDVLRGRAPLPPAMRDLQRFVLGR